MNNTLDISVIIPFKDHASMTIDCIASLQKYGPKVKEIILVSNNSKSNELARIKAFAKLHDNIQVYEYNEPFNYQSVNNWAVTKSTGSFLLFLNNDTELRKHSENLIEDMYKKAQQEDVGIVGCLLLYGDEQIIQHAGVYLVSGGQANHMYVGKRYSTALRAPEGSKDFPYSIRTDRPMTAVTAAVNLVEKKKFLSIQGFDEKFILCGGDVDLCIRMNNAGFQTWFISSDGKYILHKESQSRKFKPVTYNDFYYSYLSYMTAYDPAIGDRFLPKICAANKVGVK
jgi:GT2 family glycosyltransferase